MRELDAPDVPRETTRRHLRLVLRMRVRCTAFRLDAELAAGAPPGLSPELSERARQLCRPHHRNALAKSLEHAVKVAEAGRHANSAAVPVARRDVLRARHELLAVAVRLRVRDRVAAAGVAQVSRLLTDSFSPLYSADPRLPLWRHVRNIADSLDGPST